ncbi:MAG: hypothetical protein ACR2O4_15245 [Hyphomicrobiaceae bacterium]
MQIAICFLTGCLLVIYGWALRTQDRIKASGDLPPAGDVKRTNAVMNAMFVLYLVLGVCYAAFVFGDIA